MRWPKWKSGLILSKLVGLNGPRKNWILVIWRETISSWAWDSVKFRKKIFHSVNVLTFFSKWPQIRHWQNEKIRIYQLFWTTKIWNQKSNPKINLSISHIFSIDQNSPLRETSTDQKLQRGFWIGAWSRWVQRRHQGSEKTVPWGFWR